MDQLSEITSLKPETPNETNFQETFLPLIKEAKETLVNPPDFQDPGASLAKVKHLHQTLQQKAQRRQSLKMAEISPVLAQMTGTKIAMPGVSSPTNDVRVRKT